MVTAGMLPRAAVREVEARLRAAGCPDADFDAAELFRLAVGGDVRLADAPLGAEQAERSRATGSATGWQKSEPLVEKRAEKKAQHRRCRRQR